MEKLKVFVSSRVEEFKNERAIAKEVIESFEFLEPILSEDWGAGDKSANEKSLEGVRESDIFLGFYYNEYSEIVEKEYREARTHGKPLLLYENI